MYIAFRVFFNARFYYPVFTILFLDFGLTLEQFVLLNAVWAATIVLLEVPSGAFADTLGRRKLLVIAGLLMVIEMALLCFVPLGNPTVLFVFFLLNRILSGTAEASASGADEAMAYDSLKSAGGEAQWGKVLDTEMRARSMAFMGASILGAAVYDPALMGKAAGFFGMTRGVTQDVTMRFPIYLTLFMSIMTLMSALRMREVSSDQGKDMDLKWCRKNLFEAFRLTFEAGRWILKTPLALVIIATALLFDHVVRMILTLNSQYYRLIQLPEASFGLIGSAMALGGLFIPRLALVLVSRHSPAFNLWIMALLAWIGLVGMTFFVPVLGLLPALLVSSIMFLLNFFVSHYLNRITQSHQRATVLSFKGLSLNLAYGAVGLLYSLLLTVLRAGLREQAPQRIGEELEKAVFIRSIHWFPWYFVVMLAALVFFAKWQLRHSKEHLSAG